MRHYLNEKSYYPDKNGNWLNDVLNEPVLELSNNITVQVDFDFNTTLHLAKEVIKNKPALLKRYTAIMDSIKNDASTQYEKLRSAEDKIFEEFILGYQGIFNSPQGAFSGGAWDISIKIDTVQEFCIFINAGLRSNSLYAIAISKAFLLHQPIGHVFDRDDLIDYWSFSKEDSDTLFEDAGITLIDVIENGKVLSLDDTKPKKIEIHKEEPEVQDTGYVVFGAFTDKVGRMYYGEAENEAEARNQLDNVFKEEAKEFEHFIKSIYKLDVNEDYDIAVDSNKYCLVPGTTVYIVGDLDRVSMFIETIFAALKKTANTGEAPKIFSNTYMNACLPQIYELYNIAKDTTWEELANKGINKEVSHDGEYIGEVAFKRIKK